jgi:RNA polymerase sigma-70 factor (ECF subfamily)
MQMKECEFFKQWQEYQKKLLSFIKARVSNQKDAEDILQDVLLKSYQYCLAKNEILNLKAWLFAVANNAIVDYHKRTCRNVELYMELGSDQNEYFDLSEAIDYMVTFAKLLPEKYANPLLLFDIEGKDQKTIAQELGLSVTNTKTRIQRARKMLKARFLECCTISFSESGMIDSFSLKPTCSMKLSV